MRNNQYYTTSDSNIHSSNKYKNKNIIRIIANSYILSLLVELIPMFIEIIVIFALLLFSAYCKTIIQILLFIFMIITIGISTYIFSIIDTKLGEISKEYSQH